MMDEKEAPLYHKQYRSPVTIVTLRQTKPPRMTTGFIPYFPITSYLLWPKQVPLLARIYDNLLFQNILLKCMARMHP